jgi:hypothetical protein
VVEAARLGAKIIREPKRITSGDVRALGIHLAALPTDHLRSVYLMLSGSFRRAKARDAMVKGLKSHAFELAAGYEPPAMEDVPPPPSVKVAGRA